jgi:predicted nucleic acid-binding Zn ribbon protein
MSAPALKTHDVCGSKVRKVMSASSFAFKGSGFYVTDYGKKNSSAPTGKSEDSSKKAAPKSDACASCPAKQSAA